MQVLSKQMDNIRRNLLSFGYVRSHSNIDIPFVLIELIHSFFDLIFSWNINPKQIKLLSNAKHNDKLYSKPFSIQNITFQHFLSVNYINNPIETKYDKYLGYFIQFQSIQSNVSKILIYYELYCKQYDIYWKNMAQLTPETNNCGWPLQSLHFQSDSGYVSTSQTVINVHRETLTFESYIEIIGIEYEKNIYSKDITISDYNDHKWIVQKAKTEVNQSENKFFREYIKELMETYNTNIVSVKPIKRFYSMNFGSFNSQNWCLECVFSNRFDILLYLRLVGLPYFICAIRVQFVLTAHIGENEYKREYVQLFDRINNNCWGWGCGVISVSDLINDCDVIFGVKLNVLQIFEYGKQEPILPNKWLDFGLLSLENIFD
eukprot:326809_1